VIGEKAVKTFSEVLGVELKEVNPSSNFLKKWFKERTRKEITEILSDKIPCAPVLTEREVFEDSNVRERDMIVEIPHPKGFTYRTIATGIKFSETPIDIVSLPPYLGEDSVDILKNIGYSDEEITNLMDEEIILVST
jgi:crotonobetainyl-CoA:carnitine CoA-transferase CaiB-like acyl-CoA transferase